LTQQTLWASFRLEPSASMNPQAILDQIRWMAANPMVSMRQNALLAALQGFQRTANASPQAILRQTVVCERRA
jgi:hypothetical protein